MRGREATSSSPVEWPFSFDRHPVTGACVRPIVPHSVMLHATVVPERDRICSPAEAALEQRIGHVVEKIAQDAVALVPRDAEDASGESLVDVKRLLAGDRVRAHDRMLGARVARLVGDAVIAVLTTIVFAIMDRG